MSLRQNFRINAPAVVSEAFEDEVVIIHLESGAYYSLDQSGAAIWHLLQQGFDLLELSNQLGTTYRAGPDEIARVVPQFIAELMQEQLIVPAGAADQLRNDPFKTPVSIARTANPPFSRPTLTKFTDMQDLLLLDPIHDVDSSGWPMKK